MHKKDKPLSVRVPEMIRAGIHEEAEKNYRGFNEEMILLLAEALYIRQLKHNIKRYL